MGIVNRSLDVSQQKEVVSMNIQNTVTGEVGLVYQVPAAASIVSVKAVGIGLSGAPTAALQIQRFIAGTGNTTIAAGPALTVSAQGTSGPLSFTVSVTSLQANDVLQVVHAGTNAALKQLLVSAVIQNLQDIKSYY